MKTKEIIKVFRVENYRQKAVGDVSSESELSELTARVLAKFPNSTIETHKVKVSTQYKLAISSEFK
jgi:hypothetical protein